MPTGGEVSCHKKKRCRQATYFDEVMDAWDTQIRYYTRKSIEIEYVVDTMLEENVHDILCSALVDDCIERAKSISKGVNMTGFLACRLALPTWQQPGGSEETGI